MKKAINYSEEPSVNLRDQVSWNIQSSRANLIFTLMSKATSKYLNGDLVNWYWTVTAVRELINCDLKQEEQLKLDVIEKNANIIGGYYEKLHSVEEIEKKSPIRYKQLKLLYSKVIRQYQRYIMDLLKALGFFPVKEDRTDLGF